MIKRLVLNYFIIPVWYVGYVVGDKSYQAFFDVIDGVSHLYSAYKIIKETS